MKLNVELYSSEVELLLRLIEKEINTTNGDLDELGEVRGVLRKALRNALTAFSDADDEPGEL